jgi:hypothetical protein
MRGVKSLAWLVVNTLATVVISTLVGVAVMAAALMTGAAIFFGIVRRK